MTRQAYFNGAWIDERDLAIPVTDPGFAMGVTITERLRTFGGRVWRLDEHVERLRRSARTVGIADGVVEELAGAITAYAARNEPQREAADDLTIIVFATPGTGGEPTRCVHGSPIPFAAWAHEYTEGVATWVSDWRQTPANCWPTDLKCRSRMHYYLADEQARRQEPHSRAILLDQEGFVGEASTANVVAFRANEGIVTPKLSKVLPGVSVLVLRELAEAEGVPFVERDLSVEELLTAEEVWLSSTMVCLLPVVRCDGHPVGSGTPGPQFARMLAAWNRTAGLDIAEQARQRARSPSA